MFAFSSEADLSPTEFVAMFWVNTLYVIFTSATALRRGLGLDLIDSVNTRVSSAKKVPRENRA